MTPAQFIAARNILGLSRADMAKAMGYKPRIIGYYETGERRVNERTAMLVAGLLERHNANMEVY